MDLLGNRTKVNVRDANDVNHAVDNLTNRYNTVGGANLTYDQAGNLAVDKDGYNYEYDYENRIVKIAKDGNDIAEFAYDALGRRVRKIDSDANETTLMKRRQSILTFVLVSLILLLPTGCQQQSAVVPNADQKAELPAKANQDSKPVAKDPKSTIDNRKSQIQRLSPGISFEKTAHNFGELGIREKGECEFKFKNTGQGG